MDLALLLASRAPMSGPHSDPHPLLPLQGPAAATKWTPCTPARPATSSASTQPSCLWTEARAVTCPPSWDTPTLVRQVQARALLRAKQLPSGPEEGDWDTKEPSLQGKGLEAKRPPSRWFGRQGLGGTRTPIPLLCRELWNHPTPLFPLNKYDLIVFFQLVCAHCRKF